MAKRIVSVGECMIELSGGEGGQYRMGFAGDTLNCIWYARARLPADWTADYVTALGDDAYSAEMRASTRLPTALAAFGLLPPVAHPRTGLHEIVPPDPSGCAAAP